MHILYGTIGCHLCDDAQAMLEQAGITFCYVDVVEDDALLTEFGLHIPVFKTDLGLLYWPFNLGQVTAITNHPAS